MTRRLLTVEEHAWARDLFGPSFPARERVRVSSRMGLGGRAFVLPGPRAATVFLGRHHTDPLRTAPGLFAHELTHVWQAAHARSRVVWLARAGLLQLRYRRGVDVYDPGDRGWDEANVEQQATLVQRWVTTRSGRPPPPRP